MNRRNDLQSINAKFTKNILLPGDGIFGISDIREG
jgi:hypothetical protein